MEQHQITLNNYQVDRQQFAKYPSQGYPIGLFYATMAMVGEVGELTDKLNDTHEAEPILKEVGDVFWNIGAMCREMNAEMPFDPVRVGVAYSMVPVAAARAAELVSKAIRDDGLTRDTLDLTQERRDQILTQLSIMIAGLERLCRIKGSNLKAVLDMNIAKLTDRANRGVLSGEGDKR